MTRRDWLESAAAAGMPAVGSGDSGDFAARVFGRINELRAASGSQPLAWSEAAAACAREQSGRVEKLRFHGHNDPERGGIAERLTAAGIRWSNCGENLFSERGYEDPVHFAVVCWWYSPGHRENLLNPVYAESGVGLVQGSDKTWFVTQIFVTPAPAARILKKYL